MSLKVYGTMEVPLLEDPMLVEGSTMITENPDGTQTVTKPRTSYTCQHDASFFANPDYETIINQHQWEIDQRNIEAGIYPDWWWWYNDDDDEDEE